MFSRKTLGIAGAAILGTLVGTNAAHAVIEVTVTNGVSSTDGQVQYAIETLTTNTAVPSGGKTYYKVEESSTGGELDVTIPLGFATGGAESIIVLYTLGGMVFSEEMTAANIDMTAANGTSKSFSDVRLNGGAKGDSSVEYSITATAAVAETDLLKLSIEEIAVDPAAVGSITMLASYDVSATRSITETVTISDAVTPIKAFKESVVAASSTPVALVEEGFMKFGAPGNASSDGLTATVGSITIGLEADTLAASDSEEITTTNMATELLGTDGVKLNFTGDLGFVDDVFLATGDDCPSTGKVALSEVDDEVRSWKADAADLEDVDGTGAYLCITADGETVISESSYGVTITYGGLPNAAFPPPASTKTVGGIKRDGTTVHIPFLTAHSSYNQRIVILNRNSTAVGYKITFTAEAGVTPTAGDDAEGMLAPNSRTVLSLKNDDVVSFAEGGPPRTAATLEVVSIPGNIGVASVLVNPNGILDTVVYQD